MTEERFPAGAAVRVRDDWPETRGPVHIRTPHYIRGARGRIVRRLGAYPNPEDLAFARPAARIPLYHVAFDPAVIWPRSTASREAAGPLPAGASPVEESPAGELLVEVYEHWLEPVL